MTDAAKLETVTPQLEAKPWWQSPSTWIAVATIIACIYESGLIPADSQGYKILGLIVAALTALGLIAKRGLVEAQLVKANTVLALADKGVPANPQPPVAQPKP